MIKAKRQLLRCIICVELVIFLGVAICFIGAGMSAVAHAEELPQNDTEIVKEETQEPAEPAEPADDPTFFDRIWEWVSDNKTEILTVIGDIILVVFLIVQRVKQKKKLVDLGSDILTVKNDVSSTATLQQSVVGVTNELIAGYNKFEKAINNFDETENERYKTVLAAFAYSKAILEVLTTVYANSKNIPQGVKDLVNLKYADALKLVGDEKKLKEIAEPAATTEAAAEVDEETEE